jgi:hypothetical protein
MVTFSNSFKFSLLPSYLIDRYNQGLFVFSPEVLTFLFTSIRIGSEKTGIACICKVENGFGPCPAIALSIFA